MEFLYQLAGSVRSILFACKTRNNNDSLDPMVRSALAETVQHDRENWRIDFEMVQAELDRVSTDWQRSKDREQFLDTRIRKYRKALTERSKKLAETPHEPDYEQRCAQFNRDDEALQKIQETHKWIVVQCETLRRKLQELERKRDTMVCMDKQLHVFVEGATTSQPQHQTIADPTSSPSQQAAEHQDPEEHAAISEENRDGDLQRSCVNNQEEPNQNRISRVGSVDSIGTGEDQIKKEIDNDPPQKSKP